MIGYDLLIAFKTFNRKRKPRRRIINISLSIVSDSMQSELVIYNSRINCSNESLLSEWILFPIEKKNTGK